MGIGAAFLVVLSLLVLVVGLLFLSQATVGVGLIASACLLAILLGSRKRTITRRNWLRCLRSQNQRRCSLTIHSFAT